MERGDYKNLLTDKQEQLNLVQQAMQRQGERGIIVFEGWDAAGKGSTIRRIAWCLDPRSLHVAAISAPTILELNGHWLKRFWTRIPSRGEIGIFDRSWYGRVLVERIEGFANEAEWQRAYREINEFEWSLTEEGYRIVKLFLDISPQTQLHRLKSRLDTPTKSWKLTKEDVRNRERWHEYEKAYQEMMQECSPPHAPWHKVDANSKKDARLACFDIILDRFGQGLNVTPPPVDPEISRYLKQAK
ncbi:MAG: polyphosphate kinase [Parvibaculum sp.]